MEFHVRDLRLWFADLLIDHLIITRAVLMLLVADLKYFQNAFLCEWFFAYKHLLQVIILLRF